MYNSGPWGLRHSPIEEVQCWLSQRLKAVGTVCSSLTSIQCRGEPWVQLNLRAPYTPYFILTVWQKFNEPWPPHLRVTYQAPDRAKEVAMLPDPNAKAHKCSQTKQKCSQRWQRAGTSECRPVPLGIALTSLSANDISRFRGLRPHTRNHYTAAEL
jgi:hypothetical protein